MRILNAPTDRSLHLDVFGVRKLACALVALREGTRSKLCVSGGGKTAPKKVEPEFCASMVALSSSTRRGLGCLRQQAKRINPLPGGAEAEGFGVGGGHEEPTRRSATTVAAVKAS